MINTDLFIRDLLTCLQEAHDRGETEVHESLFAILSRHGTLSLRDGRYIFSVATATVYNINGYTRERIGLPDALSKSILAKEERA